MLTTADRYLVVLPGDAAVGEAADWDQYNATLDETHLALTGEPTRYECQPLTDTGWAWVQGEILSTRAAAGEDPVNPLEMSLPWARGALVAVVDPQDKRHEVERRRRAGAWIADGSAVIAALGGRDSVGRVLLLAGAVISRERLGDETGGR